MVHIHVMGVGGWLVLILTRCGIVVHVAMTLISAMNVLSKIPINNTKHIYNNSKPLQIGILHTVMLADLHSQILKGSFSNVQCVKTIVCARVANNTFYTYTSQRDVGKFPGVH